jgi:integrase
MPVAHLKQKLMRLMVTKLAPKAQAYLVWDTLQRGFAVQIQPTGYRAYKLIYRFHNRPRWFHIGAVDAIGLADARKMAAELMLRVIKGEDVAAEKQAERGTGTFAELAHRYVEQYAKKRNKSWQQADKLVRRNLLPTWGNLIAQTISRADVRSLMGKLSDAPVAANQTLKAASAIFSWAVKQELLTNNPCRGVEHNATVSRERILNDNELPSFWNAFGEAGVAGAALQVLLLSGQRPGEVTSMRFDQIVDNWWTLPGAPDAATGWPGTKNGQTHRIWLPAQAREIITALNVGDPFVFGQSLDLPRTMQKICAQLGVPRAVPHDLRRTHGTAIARLGFGRDALNRIQNHKGHGIADVYDRHSYAAENKNVMETVAAHLLALANGEDAQSNVIVAKF